MNNPYKNLSEDELVLADHYAETGNFSGLRKMREVSENRSCKQQVIIIRGNVNTTIEED